MANVGNVVARIQIESSLAGGPQTESGLRRIASAHDEVAEASVRNERASSSLDSAYQRMQARLQTQARAQQSLAAANDNLAKSAASASDSYESLRQIVV